MGHILAFLERFLLSLYLIMTESYAAFDWSGLPGINDVKVVHRINKAKRLSTPEVAKKQLCLQILDLILNICFSNFLPSGYFLFSPDSIGDESVEFPDYGGIEATHFVKLILIRIDICIINWGTTIIILWAKKTKEDWMQNG